MSEFSASFIALLNEAKFTREMLGAGATQIRKANYATRGIYFQAFTSLSTGLERIGKLCLMVDHYIETGGEFPDFNYMKKEICHNLALIYEKSTRIVQNRGISFRFLKGLSDPIHQNILKILSDFSEGDRYSNINLLVGRKGGEDPISRWFEKVDGVIFETYVPMRRKSQISHNARVIGSLMSSFTSVRHISETGTEITTVEEGSFRTGFFEAVAPWRQLFVLHIIRYFVELLGELQYKGMKIGNDIPFFNEIFREFYNDDKYMKTRKTWDSE